MSGRGSSVIVDLERTIAELAPRVEPAGAVLVGSVTDGLLVIPLPDGSTAITGGESRRGRPDDGYGIVFVEGELR